MKEGIVLKAPDRMEKMSDNIINQISGMVASGELKPADKIGSEKELLAQLGVSKASLREALRVLEVMGIMEIRKGLSGEVYVADVDMKTTLTGIRGDGDLRTHDLHVMGRDGVAFYTESKCVTSRWFSEEDKKETRISNWEGTICRK